jgi:hypothetical protein
MYPDVGVAMGGLDMKRVSRFFGGFLLAGGMVSLASAQSLAQCIGPICVSKPKAEKSLPSPATTPAQSTAVQTSDSSPYDRNGRACLEELCLGDGLEALAKIDWDVAGYTADKPSGTRPVDRGETNRFTNRYRGDVTGLIGYFADSKFDNSALPKMAKIVAACETQYVQGTYTSPSGNPTTVLVSMTASAATPEDQRWMVTNIKRQIPSATSPQQITDAKASLEQRYSRFVLRNRAKSGASDMFQTNTGSGFQFTLSAASTPNESSVLRQHPACGGTGSAPAKID